MSRSRSGIPYGGWCPRGGSAEDLPDPPRVSLRLYPRSSRRPPSVDPEERTRRNVRDSDADGDRHRPPGAVSAGTAVALTSVFELDRELAVIDLASDPPHGASTTPSRCSTGFPRDGSALNVAGPRESFSPGSTMSSAAKVLASLLDEL